MNNIKVKEFTMDDWGSVREYLQVISSDPNAARIELSLTEMEKYAITSLTNPMVGLFILTAELPEVSDHPVIIGILAAMCISNPTVGGNISHTYVKAAYVSSSIVHSDWGRDRRKFSVPYKAGIIFLDFVNEWAKNRQCSNICANVRMDGPLEGFYRKYGFEPYHYVIGKKVE